MRTSERDAEFRDFYFSEHARLRSIALMLVGDPGKASDLAQEALLRSYVAWYRIRRDDPGPYARKILVNLCRNHHRRRFLEARKKPFPAPDSTADHSGGVAEGLRVAAALRELSPTRRAAIVLRYYEDMTEPEIARVLDRPLSTIKSDIRRGLERLRPLLQEEAS
ncbi:MAG TPA: SigE family RNA polymerase sigma factor [Actinomycetota bacterium]|nr:SigE family RNA polymerase sigma factor [Actinomycetota bacterium]